MFFPRKLFVLGLFVLFAALAVEATSKPLSTSETAEPAQPDPKIWGIIIKLLAQAFAWATSKCIEEAAEKCRGHWPNIPKIIECGGDYLAENKGRCLFSATKSLSAF